VSAPTRSIEEVLQAHTPGLMRVPGVNGTGQGERDGRPVIVVYAARRTPEVENLPREIEGYPVDVRVIGEVRPLGK
jgi:hypothetical protein